MTSAKANYRPNSSLLSLLLGRPSEPPIEGAIPLRARDERTLQQIELLKPVFNALLSSYATVDTIVPLELSFCLPAPGGPCVLTLSLRPPGERKPRHVRPRNGGLTPRKLRLVHEHMNANLSKPIAIGELSEIACLSPSYFRRAFKESTGCAPHAYITQLRIERSKTLMRDTADSLSQIAAACGLSDQSHFSRVFRRIVGPTPRQWRHASCV